MRADLHMGEKIDKQIQCPPFRYGHCVNEMALKDILDLHFAP